MRFQVCDVAKPQGSVSKIYAQGHKVVFDDEGSYVKNKRTGKRTDIVN